MGQAKAKGCFQDSGCLALRDIFAAMDSDDDNVIRIAFLDLPQLRKNVDAVDSPVGPEIEQNHLPAQFLDAQRLTTSVNPVQTSGKVRGSDARKIGDWL